MTKAELAPKANKNRASVSCALVPTDQVPQQDENLLGVVTFGSQHTSQNIAPELTHINVDLAYCEHPVAELWYSNEVVQRGHCGNIRYSRNEQLLFGCIDVAGNDLKSLTEEIYLSIFEFLKQQQTPHILRIWNHFPGINETGKELERYQEFCVGRFAAFQRFYGEKFQQQIPAASAIGTYSGGVSVYFIATVEPGIYLENPRQVAAYHYPAQYGPCSPSFARATLFQSVDPHTLFLSGTASVVGHESLHPGDADKQLQETLNNISNLLNHDKIREYHYKPPLFPLIKIYLREQSFLSEHLKQTVRHFFGSETPLLFLQGDICRNDLLLEIEGMVNYTA
ncbi:MAG: hypothetical protein OEZ68_02145 [Gammaproteobacteria bacterium]|nr:hypothetical protein [Gammaproteobacteria bacterium]MDH5799582.1 hypothetical protein [Gammaproteobacteria bacterium]